jgi:hypothetical protein
LWNHLPPEFEKVVHYFEKIVDQDHTLARAVFSIGFDIGQGVTRDPIQFVKYEYLSTKNGDVVGESSERMKLFIEAGRCDNFETMISFSRDYTHKNDPLC